MKTTINGYLVELDLDVNGDGSNINAAYINFLDYSATFECLEAMGYLDNDESDEHNVPDETVAEIKTWLTENGYYGFPYKLDCRYGRNDTWTSHEFDTEAQRNEEAIHLLSSGWFVKYTNQTE